MSLFNRTASLPSQTARPRLEFIDGLRGAAALYVMFHHMSRQIWNDPIGNNAGQPVAMQRLIAAPFAFGHLAVDVFIVLSGFCLMLNVIRAGGTLRGGAWGFLGRRALRILPPYYAALLLSLVLIRLLISRQTGTPWDDCLCVTRLGLFAHLLLLQDVYTQHLQFWKQIDHPLWSVALEFQIYLLFPALICLWNRIGGIAATVTSFAATALAIGVLHFTPVRVLCLDYVGLFSLGVAAAAAAFSDIAPWPAIRRRTPWRIIALTALMASVVLNLFFDDSDLGGMLQDPMMGLGCAAFLLTLATASRSLLRNALQWKPLVFVGTVSFSLYLIHAPLIQVIWQYVLEPAHLRPIPLFIALLTLGSVAILGASYAFHLLYERPAIPSKRAPLPAGISSVPAI